MRMFKVKQKECIVNYLEAKTDLTYFPKILQFTQMLKKIRNLDAEIYKFPISQLTFSRYVNDYTLPRKKH